MTNEKKKGKKKSKSLKKSTSSKPCSSEGSTCSLVGGNAKYVWPIIAVFMTIALIVVIYSGPEDTGEKDELIFVESVACKEACDDFRPLAKELAEIAGLEFRKITTPIEIAIPGFMVIENEEVSNLMEGIEHESIFIEQMCQITNNEEICQKTGTDEEDDVTGGTSSMAEFNECLAENGMVIYGMEWCPACNSLVEALGGYEAVRPVYVECTEEEQRCAEESKTSAVPEVQINGEVFEGQRSPQGLAEATGCRL